MPHVNIPNVLAGGRWSSGDELDATARAWCATIRAAMGHDRKPVAAAVPTTPEGVALFIAATAIPTPVILLAPDARAWRSDPPVPPGTTLALPPSLADLAPAAQRLGCVPCVLSDQPHTRDAQLALLQAPGIVLFTSGSTGWPRPVFRSMATLLENSATRLAALGVGPGDGIIAGASLAHGNGLTRILSVGPRGQRGGVSAGPGGQRHRDLCRPPAVSVAEARRRAVHDDPAAGSAGTLGGTGSQTRHPST